MAAAVEVAVTRRAMAIWTAAEEQSLVIGFRRKSQIYAPGLLVIDWGPLCQRAIPIGPHDLSIRALVVVKQTAE